MDDTIETVLLTEHLKLVETLVDTVKYYTWTRQLDDVGQREQLWADIMQRVRDRTADEPIMTLLSKINTARKAYDLVEIGLPVLATEGLDRTIHAPGELAMEPDQWLRILRIGKATLTVVTVLVASWAGMETYVKTPAFGANPVADWGGLLAIGFAGTQVTNFVQKLVEKANPKPAPSAT